MSRVHVRERIFRRHLERRSAVARLDGKARLQRIANPHANPKPENSTIVPVVRGRAHAALAAARKND
jgi:hypothetical protein